MVLSFETINQAPYLNWKFHLHYLNVLTSTSFHLVCATTNERPCCLAVVRSPSAFSTFPYQFNATPQKANRGIPWPHHATPRFFSPVELSTAKREKERRFKKS